jgi:hypothetical protein
MSEHQIHYLMIPTVNADGKDTGVVKYLLPVLKFLYLTGKYIVGTLLFFAALIITIAIGVLGGEPSARRRR